MSGYSDIKINGSSVQELRWNLLNLDGLWQVPNRRGENRPTPYSDGDYSFGEKYFDSKFSILDFVVFPWDATGAVTASDGARYHLRKNLDDLLGILHQNTGLQTLQFTVKDGIGGTVTREIDFEILSSPPIDEYNRNGYQFALEVVAARPFWREVPLITVNENNVSTFPHAFNIDTAGNAPIADLKITLTADAPSNTPSLECDINGDTITITDVAILTSDEFVIDLGTKTFTKNGVRADSFVARNTARFMRLPPASSLAMTLDATSGTFDLQLDYYKKWM